VQAGSLTHVGPKNSANRYKIIPAWWLWNSDDAMIPKKQQISAPGTQLYAGK